MVPGLSRLGRLAPSRPIFLSVILALVSINLNGSLGSLRIFWQKLHASPTETALTAPYAPELILHPLKIRFNLGYDVIGALPGLGSSFPQRVAQWEAF